MTWIDRLRSRLQFRRMARVAEAVVAQGHGFAVRVWPLGTPPPPADLTTIEQEAITWLTDQIAVAASPYGWSSCSIIVGLVCLDGSQRTPLWKSAPPAFPKADRAAGLAAARAILDQLPLADYPTANQIEVYLLDMGAVLRQAFDTIDDGAPTQGG